MYFVFYRTTDVFAAEELLEKNGIVYFDMEDKSDRKNVQNVVQDVLNNNYNMLYYLI